MKILLITDIHFGLDNNHPPMGGPDYVNTFGSTFESFVPKLHDLIQSHDLVVNLGDLIRETKTDEDIELYKKAIGLLTVGKPVKNLIGNHELNTFSPENLPEIIGTFKLYDSFDLGDFHHILLYGNKGDQNIYYIDDVQKEWLIKDLTETKLPTIVYCHYPIDDQDVSSNYYFKERPEKAFISNREEIRKVLEDSHRVKCVFNGHLHFYNEMVINGIRYITVPSFSENDGSHKPKAECLSLTIDEGVIEREIIKITQ